MLLFVHNRVGEIADESLHKKLDTTDQQKPAAAASRHANGIANLSFENEMPDEGETSYQYIDHRGEEHGIKRFVDPTFTAENEDNGKSKTAVPSVFSFLLLFTTQFTTTMGAKTEKNCFLCTDVHGQNYSRTR